VRVRVPEEQGVLLWEALDDDVELAQREEVCVAQEEDDRELAVVAVGVPLGLRGTEALPHVDVGLGEVEELGVWLAEGAPKLGDGEMEAVLLEVALRVWGCV
jgi:hypothetical protein